MSDSFILRRWTVTVTGWGESVEVAPTCGKALSRAWSCDAFSNLTFGQFLKIARCRLSPVVPPDFGAPITVLGKPAFYLGCTHHVQFAWPGGEFVLHAHPYDVEPESYRPLQYRRAA